MKKRFFKVPAFVKTLLQTSPFLRTPASPKIVRKKKNRKIKRRAIKTGSGFSKSTVLVLFGLSFMFQR
jgi:hypothetical protein